MSIRGLNWQTWTMRFVAGLNQRMDARSLESPELTICKDAMFDKLGGIQTRYPFGAAQSGIFGGGTIANARREVVNGDERLLFTKDSLYSWNAQLSKWVRKGTHLAVKLTEKNVFATGGEQVEIDRAELSNTIVYTWRDGSTVYVGALDKATGAVSLAPTALSATGAPKRPRLVALATKILLFTWQDGSGGSFAGVVARALDPADVATGVASAATNVLASTTLALHYDATRITGADQAVCACMLSPNTSYSIATVTAGLAVATATKARTCDGPIAVACAPTGTHLQIARANGNVAEGDYIALLGFADVYTNQAFGLLNGGFQSCNQMTAAFRTVQDGGQYRCYVFFSSGRQTSSAGWGTESIWVDTGNNLGAKVMLVLALDVGSRAFDHDGRVYVWLAFAGAAGLYLYGSQLQNASFLYRDDGFLAAKSATARGGGFLQAGHLPGVANVGTGMYAYGGTERSVFGALPSANFTGRRPRDVVFTFDSNEARRTAQLGKTLYIAGGEILQYDGQALTEVGFHVWPWSFNLGTAAGGNVANGTYAIKLSYRGNNARAEIDRSAAIRVDTIAVAAGPKKISTSNIIPLYVTHRASLAVEVWRSLKDPIEDAPYYLATSSDPSVLANPNRYLPNDTTVSILPTLDDTRVDGDADDFGTNPQDATLPSLAPPAASIIMATDTRLFLAGVAGEPNNVWYSKLRADGEVAAFNGALFTSIPAPGGEITALALLNGETPVVFRRNAIYALDGGGFDNTGGGNNFVARRIPGEVGAVSQESVCATERGIYFKSSKGWQLLTNGWAVQYVGGPIADYDGDTIHAVHAMEQQHEVRVLTSSRMLVLNTLASDVLGRPTWSEWSVSDGVHAAVWNGVHEYLTATGPRVQQAAYADVDYGIDVELAFVKLNDLQGYGLVDYFMLLGEFRSACNVRVRLARDYWKDGDGVYFQDKTHTPALAAGRPLQLRHSPSIKPVQALKVRITVTPTTAGESVRLTGLSFLLGIEAGLYRNLASAAKQ